MFTGWWSWRGGRGRWGDSERVRKELAQENGHGAGDQVLGFLFDGSILCLVGTSEFDASMIDFILTIGVEPHLSGSGTQHYVVHPWLIMSHATITGKGRPELGAVAFDTRRLAGRSGRQPPNLDARFGHPRLRAASFGHPKQKEQSARSPNFLFLKLFGNLF